MSAYSIDDLVKDIRAVQAKETDNRAILAAVTPLATRMAQDLSWVKPECYASNEDQGFGVVVLHEEPDYSLLVETVCWMPGRGVKPHDHKTWGVVVGLDGEERNINWLRQDDGGKDGYADIKVSGELMIKNGVYCTMMPDDIHSVHNDGDKPSLSLHIYGRSLTQTGRFEYDPEAKTVIPCPKRERASVQ